MSREIRRFDISFKNPSANFGVGDVVAGNVNLESAQDIKLKGEISFASFSNMTYTLFGNMELRLRLCFLFNNKETKC